MLKGLQKQGIGSKVAGVLAIFLAGCSVEPATQAMLDAYHLSEGAGAERALNPAFSYLRVLVDGREAFLALGYVDPAPAGPIQVWYSGNGDVLRLQEGRVVGTSIKVGVEWSGVVFRGRPDWGEIGAGAEFVRERDVSPGYRYGLRDVVRIRPIPAPKDSGLARVASASLSWYEETVTSGPEAGLQARYAVMRDGQRAFRVVYGEQCLSREYCFSWQEWPVSRGDGN